MKLEAMRYHRAKAAKLCFLLSKERCGRACPLPAKARPGFIARGASRAMFLIALVGIYFSDLVFFFFPLRVLLILFAFSSFHQPMGGAGWRGRMGGIDIIFLPVLLYIYIPNASLNASCDDTYS